MAIKQPAEIASAAVASGEAKAHSRWDKVLVASFLAGAYIAFGGLVSIVVAAGLDPKMWGGLPTLFNGATFTLGLVLVVIAGSDLLTGNMLLVPISAMTGRVHLGSLGRNFVLVFIGNLAGALFVAYFLAVQSGVIGHASSGASAGIAYERLAAVTTLKAIHETDWQIFLRAVGCNWLVCLAVWISLAADSVSGKILGVFFPIMAFVAMGFDHVVANMFFLPAGIFAGVPGLDWGNAGRNIGFAFLGNLVGAVIFVALAYWYLYVHGTTPKESRTATPVVLK